MPGGNKNIKPSDGKQFSSEYQPNKEIWTESKGNEFFNELIDWLIEDDENVFLNDFLYFTYMPNHKEVSRTHFNNLPSQLKEKFSSCRELYGTALKMQETKLVKFGVFDRLNANMTKFVLTNCHGWKENKEPEKPPPQDRTITYIDMNPE
jgi:hypothetical protein